LEFSAIAILNHWIPSPAAAMASTANVERHSAAHALHFKARDIAAQQGQKKSQSTVTAAAALSTVADRAAAM
jgi:hypothetical protein